MSRRGAATETEGQDLIAPSDEQEFDFSNDSTVEAKEGIWTIIAAEENQTDSDKGTGVQHIITFTGDAVPFPVTVKQFVQYDSKLGASTAWVKRSRGVLKMLAKAATGEPKYKLRNLVGKQVRATTKDDGNGYATLTKFRPVSVDAAE